MSDISPQKLVRRCTEAGVVEVPQLDAALNEAGGVDTELSKFTLLTELGKFVLI